MFMAQDPQMPSLSHAQHVRRLLDCPTRSQQASRVLHAADLHDLRKASVGSISSLILNSTSSIMGPQLQQQADTSSDMCRWEL